MTVRKLGEMAQVMGADGEVVEEFESSGCVYNDLGCCQGCPTCSIRSETYKEEALNFFSPEEYELIREAEYEDNCSDMACDFCEEEGGEKNIELVLDTVSKMLAAEVKYMLMTGDYWRAKRPVLA